jgi:plastocyanin
MTRRLGFGASLAAATLILAACSGGGAAATTAPVPAATNAPTTPTNAPLAASTAAGCEVVTDGTGTPAEIKGFAFPAGLTVKAGEAIAWTNADGAPHTVTFDDGSCASGSIGGGATVVVKYTTPGTYAFHCAIHAKMTGTLEVKG